MVEKEIQFINLHSGSAGGSSGGGSLGGGARSGSGSSVGAVLSPAASPTATTCPTTCPTAPLATCPTVTFPVDPVQAYRQRIAAYRLVASLAETAVAPVSRRTVAMGCANERVYRGGWSGEVFSYSNALEFQEQFRAANQAVLSINTCGDALIIVHAQGTVTAVTGKHGVSGQIEGFNHGIVHPAAPVCLAQTSSGLLVYNLEQGKVAALSRKIAAKPVAVHPLGRCLLVSGRSGGLVDLRTMEVVVPVESPAGIAAGMFHSSGVELVLGRHTRRLQCLDARNMKTLHRVRTRAVPKVLHEFQSTVYYSGAGMDTSGICPITGSELFSYPAEATAFASTDTAIFLADANNTVHRFEGKLMGAEVKGVMLSSSDSVGW